jgi:hypothetical protein
MANQLIPSQGQNGQPVLKLRREVMKTSVPEHAPRWFTDYQKAVALWVAEAHDAIQQLHHEQHRLGESLRQALERKP